MYELVLIHENGREEVAYVAATRREVELNKERHIRSQARGFAEIRERK